MVRLMTSATAIIVLLCCTVSSAAPRSEQVYRLPPELEGRARIVKLQAPRAADPNAKPRDGLAEWETPTHPADIVVEVINDEAVARGTRATGPGIEAIVFFQMLDSGYGWFMDNEPGTMQWSQMIFGNGWVPGTDLSSWMARVYVSSYNYGAFDGTGGFTIELWDGDPLGIQDTTCNGGSPAPIAGTNCTFTDLPEGVAYDLKCVFAAKVPINCDRVFGVVWAGNVCRWAWRMSDGFIYGGAINAPQVGGGDAMGSQWGCDQFGYCPTPSGYTAGFCCDDQSGNPGEVVCDHTDADENNWIPAGGGCNPVLGPHATFCNDGAADYYFAYGDEAPVYYNNFVGSAYAVANTYIGLVPVSADAPPGHDPTPAGWRISGNEIILEGPGHRVWLEIQIGDWDLEDAGVMLKAWRATVDSTGYSSGEWGTLAPALIPCSTSAACIAAFGGYCTWGPAYGAPCRIDQDCPSYPPPSPPATCGSTYAAYGWGGPTCDFLSDVGVACTPGFIYTTRCDYVFYHEWSLGGVDTSTLDYAYGATTHIVDDPEPLPDEGLYGGTLVLEVPPGAAGTFTIVLQLPNRWTHMSITGGQFVDLLGLVPAKITIVPFFDCNENGVPDEQDISDGHSGDCNFNKMPDECEPDCNTNGTADGCDISSGPSTDCDFNGVPDECEPGLDVDCNTNGIIDVCDIAAGRSRDCNFNSTPDECESFLACELQQLTPWDEERMWGFGRSVSMGADSTIVGSYSDDHAGDDSGSAYVFRYDDNGTPLDWTDDGFVGGAKLAAADAEAGDQFGWSVSIDGDRAVVGARFDDDAGQSSGAAYVFRRDDNGTPLNPSDDLWVEEAKLVASDTEDNDRFGHSVAIDDDHMVVGAVYHDGAGRSSGAAYVFGRNDNGTASDSSDDYWVEDAKLIGADTGASDYFGQSVSISGDLIAVGADGNDPAGAAYVFRLDDGDTPSDPSDDTWVEEAKLIASDADDGDHFGISVSVNAHLAIVGASGHDGVAYNAGAAFVFRRDDNGTSSDPSDDHWVEHAKLSASDASGRDGLGTSVSLSGDLAVVGAPGDDRELVDCGGAYVFWRDNNGSLSDPSDDLWVQIAKVTPTDVWRGHEFGVVSIADDRVLVGTQRGPFAFAFQVCGPDCHVPGDNGDGRIPAVSAWGMLVLVLGLAVLGKVCFARRRGASTDR